MNKAKILTACLIGTLSLSACSHSEYREKKAPCSPTAFLGSNPCELIPINFAFLDIQNQTT